MRWLDTLRRQADALPEDEQELIQAMLKTEAASCFLPSEYGLG
jgi:hypothetical protein